MIATVFVILPPSLLRKLTALRYTSIVAISGILYITLVMLYRAMNTHSCGLAETAEFSCTMGQCMIEANAALGNYTGYADCSLYCEGCEPSPIKSAVSHLCLYVLMHSFRDSFSIRRPSLPSFPFSASATAPKSSSCPFSPIWRSLPASVWATWSSAPTASSSLST